MFLNRCPQVQEEEKEEKEEEDGKEGAPWVEGSMCEEAENVKDDIDRFRDRTNHKVQRRRIKKNTCASV